MQVRELEAISQRSKALFDDVSRGTSLLHSSRSFVRCVFADCARCLLVLRAVSMTLLNTCAHSAYTDHTTRIHRNRIKLEGSLEALSKFLLVSAWRAALPCTPGFHARLKCWEAGEEKEEEEEGLFKANAVN